MQQYLRSKCTDIGDICTASCRILAIGSWYFGNTIAIPLNFSLLATTTDYNL
jgi:hypothetical protein